MTDETIRQLAANIAAHLFATSRGDPATRLVPVAEEPGVAARVVDARGDGGYCRAAVRGVIEDHLRAALGVRREKGADAMTDDELDRARAAAEVRRLRAALAACEVAMDTAALHGVGSVLPPAYRDSWAAAHAAARAALGEGPTR